jgi:hypothetical protein
MSEIMVRMAKPGDIGFIKRTWLYSYYNGNTDMQRVEKDDFMEHYNVVLNKILTSPNTIVKVACLCDDPDTIISFSAVEYFGENKVLHFVYTKKLWRGNKIHDQIIPEDLSHYSHITRQYLKIKPKHLKFNPFYAWSSSYGK